MAQRSPGERGDARGEHHAASKIRPKSTLNLINHHPNQFASTSIDQIYEGAEGFCLEKRSWSTCLLTKEEFGDGAATPAMGSATSSDPLQRCGGATPSSRSAHAPTTPRPLASPAPASPPTASRLPRSVKMSKQIQAETQLSGCSYCGALSEGTADRAVGLNSQQSTSWSWKVHPGRSYAEVVRNGSARRPGTVVRTAMQSPSPAPQRRRKVFFLNSPRVVFFQKDSAPASIRILCSLLPHCEPRSYLKQPKVPGLESFARAALPLPTKATSLFVRHPAPPTNKIQTDFAQAPWQPVRERYWWRRKKIGNVCSSPTARHHNSEKFKEKVGDRCFNCLARGHKVAQCRDPPKCWRCRGSGHFSSHCTSKFSSKRLRSLEADEPHKQYRGESPPRRSSAMAAVHPLYRGQISQERERNSKSDFAADTMEVPSSHTVVTGIHAKLGQQDQYHAGVGTKSKSDDVRIVPEEHSPTTQQLEAWLGSLAKARTTRPHLDDITFACSDAHPPKITSPRTKTTSREPATEPAEMRVWRQVWRDQQVDNHSSKTKAVNESNKGIKAAGNHFSEELVSSWQHMSSTIEKQTTIRCSDAILIIPVLSLPTEQHNVNAEAISGNKRDDSTLQQLKEQQQVNGQISDAIVLEELHNGKLNEGVAKPITGQESRADDSLLTLSCTSDSETVLEQKRMSEDTLLGEPNEVASTALKYSSTMHMEISTKATSQGSDVQEIRAENSPSTLSSTSVSEPRLESEHMTEDILLEEQTEFAPTVQQTLSILHTELETDNNVGKSIGKDGQKK